MTGVASFKGNIVFIDKKARQVKEYNPQADRVQILLEDQGEEGQQDSTGETCRFVQVHGICSLEKTIVLADVATGTIKLVPGLSETASFLRTLGCLYGSFGIHAKGMRAESVTIKEASQNLSQINNYFISTVAKVKKQYDLKDASATNGRQGTCPTKRCLPSMF